MILRVKNYRHPTFCFILRIFCIHCWLFLFIVEFLYLVYTFLYWLLIWFLYNFCFFGLKFWNCIDGGIHIVGLKAKRCMHQSTNFPTNKKLLFFCFNLFMFRVVNILLKCFSAMICIAVFNHIAIICKLFINYKITPSCTRQF